MCTPLKSSGRPKSVHIEKNLSKIEEIQQWCSHCETLSEEQWMQRETERKFRERDEERKEISGKKWMLHYVLHLMYNIYRLQRLSNCLIRSLKSRDWSVKCGGKLGTD